MKNKQHLNQFMYELFWIFFIGCFLGVVIESIWCLVTRGYYESRSGLIYGPFNLVYGFGVLLMTIGIVQLNTNLTQSFSSLDLSLELYLNIVVAIFNNNGLELFHGTIPIYHLVSTGELI